MSSFIYDLNSNLQPTISEVGGKAINLIELSKIDGIHLPKGFCITTSAFAMTFENHAQLKRMIEELNDSDDIEAASEKIRELIRNTDLSKALVDVIESAFNTIGKDKSYAIRSSATAEDLPNASFAGQHDSYLNIISFENVLEHIKMCWASLFTTRAIVYRYQNNFKHSDVKLAVIVQELINSESSGVMFTADLITSNRRVLSIDASYGLGEAVVSGYVDTDNYLIRNGEITRRQISCKKIGIYPSVDGFLVKKDIDDSAKKKSVLTDTQALELERIGRHIESHFNTPQDIEWCIEKGKIFIVQSRPITTLYPLPDDTDNRVYISSGHLQMMTDPIKPLGMYFYRSVIGNPPSKEIGGRLYLDLSHDLSSGFGRLITKNLLKVLGDSLLTDAVYQLIKNKTFINKLPKGKEKVFDTKNNSGPIKIMVNAYKAYKQNDPNIVKKLIDIEEKAIEEMGEQLSQLSGEDVFRFIEEDHADRRMKIANPRNAGVLTAAMLSTQWFDRKIKKWFGEKNAADSIIMSIPNSITTDTGFLLMDIADVVRKYPRIIEYLKKPNEDTFLDEISSFEGGDEVVKAFNEYLYMYGMRCSGDIDITVSRWIEEPSKLAPIILSNIQNFDPQASKVKYDEGIAQSEKIIEDLIKRVELLPRGKKKAKKIRCVSSVIRNYIGFREYPKFSYMKRYFLYKKAMLKEAEKLVNNNLLLNKEDIYYLTFDELRDMVKGNNMDTNVIEERKKNYQHYERLTPPRVILSDGDVIIGKYDTSKIPKNALPGIPVSAGIVEGRARVVNSLKDAYITEGDILVTEFTDPSWTPTFVSINGLITEVGGLTTHGAVIAREYGLLAVVSVTGATKLIKDGQLIRINGTEGYVEILSES